MDRGFLSVYPNEYIFAEIFHEQHDLITFSVVGEVHYTGIKKIIHQRRM